MCKHAGLLRYKEAEALGSLQGAERRRNLDRLSATGRDCFAALAMTAVSRIETRFIEGGRFGRPARNSQ